MSDLSPKDKAIAESFLTPLESPQQLRDWIYTFFDIDFPMGSIDPDSNASPVEWLYDAYNAVRYNQGDKKPVYVVYSSRDSYKTLSCAALEVLLMVHFQVTVAHMAAIEPQSKKAVQYVNSFIKKIRPYLAYHGRDIESQNTRNIAIRNEEDDICYLTIIICTLTGANSEHTNIMVVDEVDVVRFPQAYEEAKLIPGVLRGRHPITIMTSTRKFAFGLMQKEIDLANEYNYPVLHWNLLDITEYCGPERHRPEEPKQIRYTAKKLPLRNISKAEFDNMIDERKDEFDRQEAYAGCAECPLLPVCKMRLAHRSKDDVGGLYKPIDFTINQFRKVEPDMAEAQLMCWKPSAAGLVYPRFDEQEGENVITLSQAWESFVGTEAPPNLILEDLIELFHRKGISFYVGGDWGFRHAFALIAGAILPSREFWLFETLAIPGLEYEDMIKYALMFRDKYKPRKWFMDTAQPMFIKGFKKRKMNCKEFKKDVMGGIEAIRGQIVDASNRRTLKVIKTEENDFLIKGFRHHHFMMDAAGRMTQEPDDEEYADAMDSLRYMGQNLFAPKGNIRAGRGGAADTAAARQRQAMYQDNPNKMHSDIIVNKIRHLATNGAGPDKGKSDSGTVLWDFSNPYDLD